MNKKIIKILCILAIFSYMTGSVVAKTKIENVGNEYDADIEDNLENEKKTVNGKNIEIKNYKAHIIEKEGITFVVYEHIKSGAKIIVYFKKDKDAMEISFVLGTHFDITPKDNKGKLNVIAQMLNNSIVKELRESYDTTTLANNGRLRGFLYPIVDTAYNAMGFDFEVQKWTPKMVEVIANNLRNPKFFHDNGESLKAAKDIANFHFLYSKRDWNNRKWRGEYESSSFFGERTIGGLYENSGKMEEINNLSLKEVEDFYLKNVVPANSITIISEDTNPDYKEILELMDEKYLQYFNKNDVVFEKNDVNKLTNTEPIRKLGVDSIKYTTYDDPKRETDRHTNEDAKSAVKLTWSTENFSIQEQDVFRFGFLQLRKNIENIIKEMGYIFSEISYDELNKLFSVKLYRKERNVFEENKIRENSKKILEKIYEEIKNADDKKLREIYFSPVMPDNILEYAIRSYRDEDILHLIHKSFSETRNPFSEKFFEIKNNVILDDIGGKKFLENVKNNKNAFKKLIDTPAKYIDFVYEKEKKEEIPNYPSELQFPLNISIKVKYDILKNIVSEIIMNKFLIPKINGRMHVPLEKIRCMPTYDKKDFLKIEIDAFKDVKNEEFLNEIKDILIKELPNMLENYTPTQEELDKEKEKITFSIREDLKYRKRLVEKERKLLNNDEELKKQALVKKQANEEYLESLNKSIEVDNEKLKNANINEEEKKNVEEQLKLYTQRQKEYESKISLEYCIEEIKKQTLNSLKEYEKKEKEIEENLKAIENTTLDDLKNAIKSIKIPTEISMKR